MTSSLRGTNATASDGTGRAQCGPGGVARRGDARSNAQWDPEGIDRPGESGLAPGLPRPGAIDGAESLAPRLPLRPRVDTADRPSTLPPRRFFRVRLSVSRPVPNSLSRC